MRSLTTNLDYSTMWRVFPVKWTDEAIRRVYRSRMTDAIAIEDAGERGIIETSRAVRPGRFHRQLPRGVPRQLTVLRLVVDRRIGLAGPAVNVAE
jgi:hypothetical protein